MIFEEERLPDAKESSTLLSILYWLEVLTTLVTFLYLTLVMCGLIVLVIIIADKVYQDYKNRDRTLSESKQIVARCQTVVSMMFGDNMCAICFAEFKKHDDVVQLRCHRNHIFHAKCLEDLLNSGHRNCPLCRMPL